MLSSTKNIPSFPALHSPKQTKILKNEESSLKKKCLVKFCFIVTCVLDRIFSLLLEPDMQRAQLIYQEIRKSSPKMLVGLGGWEQLYMLFNIFLSCVLSG